LSLPLPNPVVKDPEVQSNFEAISTNWPNAGGRGTTLPSSPVDGQDFYYVADDTNGVVWHFKYRSTSASSYKWEYVGGPPLFAKIDTDETFTADSTYHDPTTAGPSVTIPLAGDWQAWGEAEVYTTSAVGGSLAIAVGLGGTTPTVGTNDQDRAFMTAPAVASAAMAFASHRGPRTGLSASTAAKLMYVAVNATAHARFRRTYVLPIRVG
jgi:hypothetical protein